MANELTLGQLLSAGAQGTQSGPAASPFKSTESVKGMVDIVNFLQGAQPNYVPGQRQSTNVIDRRGEATSDLLLGAMFPDIEPLPMPPTQQDDLPFKRYPQIPQNVLELILGRAK